MNRGGAQGGWGRTPRHSGAGESASTFPLQDQQTTDGIRRRGDEWSRLPEAATFGGALLNAVLA